MLNINLRSEIKEALIILVFAGLMIETLSLPTIAVVLAGVILVWFRKKPNKMVRNILTLALFGAYWMTYGKVIDPEVGMNFLTSIIVIKLLEKETVRDRYMIFFGIMLLVSAGSLFQRTLSYVLFFTVSFFILIQDFYGKLKLNAKIVDILQSLIWVLPFTAFLFFFVPRMINPFQLEKGTPKEGEIGYTPDVNISEIESLASNDSAVFQVTVSGPIPNQQLYWRGNTLTFTDGWNWPLMPQDRPPRNFLLKGTAIATGVTHKIRVFSQQEFYFSMDHPASIITAKGSLGLNHSRTMVQNRWETSLRYQSIVDDEAIPQADESLQAALRSGLKNNEKVWIDKTFRSTDLPRLQDEIKLFFQREGFAYSLSPGRVSNVLDFLQNKKIGFCSHYASAVAQILRVKNIPARLVSGFQGGSYNKFADFYLITQNDAHVWVEAIHEGKWLRLDPTEWIVPDRIMLGGETFRRQVGPQNNLMNLRNFGKNFTFIRDWQQWFAQWDFKFYQLLEEMDYYGQEAILEKLNFKREWIFTFIPMLLAFFMGLYVWHLSVRRPKVSELDIIWKIFQSKMTKRGLNVNFHSLAEIEKIIKNENMEVQLLWKSLVNASFDNNSEIEVKDLKKKMQRL